MDVSEAHDIVKPMAKAGAARVLLAGLGLLATASRAPAQDTGTVVVHLADESQLPLRGWSLSYELSIRQQGQPLAQALVSRRASTELWLGKKVHPVGGARIEIEYGTTQREREVDGAWRKVPVPVAEGLALTGTDGKRERLKIVPPDKSLLAPEAGKKDVVYPRTLDLLGESLTGTRRSFCLLSYTSLVECADDPAFRVVRLEFLP